MSKLSICIPTYNRSRYLRELLESIARQDCPEIEVIVSDDASPDDSVEVAKQFQGRVRELTVLDHPVNLGMDGNFLAVTNVAKGTYIWLMGDDDRIEPGGVARVLSALEAWPGVIGLTLGVVDYDKEMQTATGIRQMPPTQSFVGASALFSKAAELLGFMSALVIDRERWATISKEPDISKYHNYYVQVYIIGRAIGLEGLWGIVREPCVGFRTGNDQLRRKYGWLKRLEFDVAAYEQIAVGLFGKGTKPYRAIKRRIFDTHVMARVLNAKTAPGATGSIPAAIGYLFKYYGDLPQFWMTLLPTLAMPKWAVSFVRQVYKRFSPSSGEARARVHKSVGTPSWGSCISGCTLNGAHGRCGDRNALKNDVPGAGEISEDVDSECSSRPDCRAELKNEKIVRTTSTG